MQLTDRGRDAWKSLKEDLHSLWVIVLIVLMFGVPIFLVYAAIHFMVKYW